MVGSEPGAKTGGAVLVVGHLLVLAVLFRHPASGLAAATAGPRSFLYFLALPIVGLAAGVYAYADGPYSGVLLFAGAQYTAVFGLALAVGIGDPSGTAGVLQGVGLVLFGLSVVAVLAGLRRLAAYLGFDAAT